MPGGSVPVLSLAGNAGVGEPRAALITLLTFVLLALLTTAAAAVGYRWYFGVAIPGGVSVLVGASVVALYLNTSSLSALISTESAELLTVRTVVFNVAVLTAAAAVAPLGRYAGDRLALGAFTRSGVAAAERDTGRLLGAIRRRTPVRLPEAAAIEDLDAYEPVTAETKAELAEQTLFFSRQLAGEALRERVVEQIKSTYEISHVALELAADGTVAYLAVGSRPTGIGPTLAPGRVAVALIADPPAVATPGDVVQIWQTGGEPTRVATGEFRAAVGDVTTVALDESDADAIAVDGTYRLVTLPAEPQADREFASLLRRADETMATVPVASGSRLTTMTVDDVAASVALIRDATGDVRALPAPTDTFAAGDTAYLIGRPEVIRRVEADASTPEAGDLTQRS